jgi:hypothetical protein
MVKKALKNRLAVKNVPFDIPHMRSINRAG